ncbi:MAG: hypothetical protein ACJASR_000588 [Psychroserpens sp.]|jgi:hypothetical protein
MIGFFKYFFIAFLFCHVLFAQESSNSLKLEQISEEKWENIVDYLNAEVTALPMFNYKKGDKGLSEKEKPGLYEVSMLLFQNSMESPVSSSDLEKVVRESWGRTYDSISRPIDSLKSYTPKILDSLFLNIENISVFKKYQIGQSPKFKELKKSIIQSLESKKALVIKPVKEADLIIPESKTKISRRAAGKSYYSHWMIPSLILLISTIILFIKWRNLKEKYEEEISSKLRFEKQSSLSIENLEKQIAVLRKQNDRRNIDLVQKTVMPTPIIKNDRTTFLDEEHKSPEVALIVPETAKQPEVLYAGKPTIENKFTNLSNSPISNQTIFKLTLHEGGLIADFEIDLVDTYITRSVTNAPDEHLYRVCNQENSNKDFSREIITVKKGLAFLMDGQWSVKEDNKATIKFQ